MIDCVIGGARLFKCGATALHACEADQSNFCSMQDPSSSNLSGMPADSSDSSTMSIRSDDGTLMALPLPGRGYGADGPPRSDPTATSSSSVGGLWLVTRI